MTSPSRSRADLPALCQPFYPTREYLENGPQLSTRAQAEIQRYREFNRPVIPTSSDLDNRHSYRETDTRYPRRPSSLYHLSPVAGDSWRRHDQADSPAYMLHDERQPSASSQNEPPRLQYPYSKPVPSTQPQYASYSYCGPSIHPFSHRGSSPRLYSLSQNPLYSRPGVSSCLQHSSYLQSRLSPQTTYRSWHHERSPQGQHSYFSSLGPSAQPQYSSLQAGSSSNMPFSSHSPPSWPPFSSYPQPGQSSPLPYSSQSQHPSSLVGPSSRLPYPSYLESGISQRPDPSYLQLRPSVSPHAQLPPLALNSSRRPDIRNLLSDPLDQLEAQERSLDWLLQEAQRRGIDVKAILISHLFPKPIPPSNQSHLLRDESPTRNRKRRLFDGDSDAGPSNSKCRETASLYEQKGRYPGENMIDRQSSSYGSDIIREPAVMRSPRLQSTARIRITLGDSDSTLRDSERDGTESSEESARNDESNSQDETTCHDEIIIQDKGDGNSDPKGTTNLDENSNHDENPIRTEISNQIESSTHNDSLNHNQSRSYITTGGSETEELPIFRRIKTKGKRKFNIILSSDDSDSGSSSKRLKVGSFDESVHHNESRHKSLRFPGSKDDLKDYDDNPADAAPDNTTHDNNANPASRGPVPLRRSSRIPKMRIRNS